MAVGQVILNVFLASIPAVAGFSGYRAIRGLAAKANMAVEDTKFVGLSRQFIIAAIFTYVLVIFVVTSLTDVWHPK